MAKPRNKDWLLESGGLTLRNGLSAPSIARLDLSLREDRSVVVVANRKDPVRVDRLELGQGNGNGRLRSRIGLGKDAQGCGGYDQAAAFERRKVLLLG